MNVSVKKEIAATYTGVGEGTSSIFIIKHAKNAYQAELNMMGGVSRQLTLDEAKCLRAVLDRVIEDWE